MTKEELEKRKEFKRRMIAKGKLPLNDEFLMEEERAFQEQRLGLGARPDDFSDEEWKAAVGNREAFKKRMQSKGKLPKDSELTQRTVTELKYESRLREEYKKEETNYQERIEALEKKLRELGNKNQEPNE